MAQTFVYNSGTYQETNSGTIDLEFGLFFDGTLNSFENTTLRLKILNKVEEGKRVEDYIIDNERDTIEVREEKKKKSSLMILPTDTEQEIEKKEKAIDDERKRLHEIEKTVGETRDYQKADKRGFLDKQGVDNSLMNDYTNVARMWKCCDENYRIYIEGIGTTYRDRDVDAGFQFGSGDTGIRGKVRKGCEKLAWKIIQSISNFKDFELIKVTLDVFGFSRGAAAARNFLYEVNSNNKRKKDFKIYPKYEDITIGVTVAYDPYGFFAPNDMIQEKKTVLKGVEDKDGIPINDKLLENGKMPKYGYLGYYLLQQGIDLNTLKLHIRFLGIYDTVSSYEEFGNIEGNDLKIKGMEQATYRKDYFKDDVEQLQLNNLGKFQKAVHFTAMDEHRENFSLTKLRPQESNCNYIEKAFPGVHCDIGGAYETGTEYVDEIDTSNHSNLHNLKKELIAEHWFKEKELEIGVDWHNVAFGVLLGWLTKSSLLGGATVYRKLSGTRLLRKEYSYIPLHFMEEFFDTTLKEDANKRITIIKKRITSEYSIENDPESILGKAKDRLRTYVFRDEKKAEKDRSEVEKEWRFISDEERKKLLQEEGRKVIDEIKSKRRKEQEKKKKEDQNMLLLEGGTYKKTVTFDSEPKINYAKVLQEVYKRNSIFETQDILKKLRNKYLHWSANRDWFGMDPTSDRKRKEY